MKSTRPGWIFLSCWLLAMAVSLALLIYPLYVIYPFRAQGARELLAALTVTRFRWIGMALCVGAVLTAGRWYWRREQRTMRRLLAALGVVIVAGIALLSRVNIFEQMFHPFQQPTFSAAGQAKLDGREMVIAVKGVRSARAYPIRSLSYHHVLNDVLDGVPIVATY